MKKNKAFSLVELSVVILIIGILIAGVTQSGRLIRQIKLSTARSLTSSSDVTSIRDVTAWFEASSEGVFTDSNGNTDVEDRVVIKAWRDVNPQKSTGDKPILTNDAGNAQPKYISSGINGIPSVYFDGGSATSGNSISDGTGDYLSSIAIPTMPLITNDKTYSMFAVFRSDLGKATNTGIITQIGDTSAQTNQQFASIGFIGGSTVNGNPGLITASSKTNSWLALNPINDQTDYIVGAVVDFATPATVAVASVKLYVNSLTPVSYLTGQLSDAGTAIKATRFTVGANSVSTPANFFTGMISEVIIFDRKLKDEEAQSVMKYLRKKYNINI